MNICKYFTEHKSAPTLNIISQIVSMNREVSALLEDIKDCAEGVEPEIVLEQFENYLRQVKFQKTYKEIGELYAKQDRDKALKLLQSFAEWQNDFSLRQNSFVDVIETFESRFRRNREKHNQESKLKPITRFYIDGLDEMNGGRDLRTQLTCFLAPTGVGKSHAARWIGKCASQIDGLKDRLDEINIVEIIKHQSVLKLEKMGNLTPMFEEFFVAVKDLSKKFDPNVDLTGNKWLFLYLSQTLDKKTMYSFLFSDIKNKPQKVSLNLNLSTMFLPEFEDFVKRIEEDGQKIVVEVQVMDILNNLAAYFDAKELLHQEGHQILIDAASIEMLQVLNVKKLEPDYIKIFWHTLMEEYEGNALGVKQMLEDIGVDKIILAKCLDEKALRWGIKNGIRAFQGPYMDLAEVALIKSKCPNGKVCTTEECLQRRKLIAGAFRDQCLHKDFLEKETN